MSKSGPTAEQVCEWRECQRVFVRKGQQGGNRRRFCSDTCRTKHHQWVDAQATQHPELAVSLAARRAVQALSASRVESALPMMSPELQRNLLKSRDVLQEIAEQFPDDLSADGSAD